MMTHGQNTVLREIHEIYRTDAERAAYRAGMSTAFGICDELARDRREAHTKRGRVTKSGAIIAAMATACGDAIETARALAYPNDPENYQPSSPLKD